MPRNWSHLAQRRTEDGYTEDDFKRAAYRLVAEQVLQFAGIGHFVHRSPSAPLP